MELRLWICWIVALASAVKGFKITDVDPKFLTLQPGGKVVLMITWETESDDEKKGQISVGLHLDGKSPLEGITPPTPVSPSPSIVTINNVAAGKYRVYAVGNFLPPATSRDAIEIKVQENDPPTQSQPPLPTEQQTVGAGPASSHDGGTPLTPTSTTPTTSPKSTTSMNGGPEPSTSTIDTRQQPHRSMAGLIAGPVAGIVILIAIVSCVITFRRRTQGKKLLAMERAFISPFPDTAPTSDTIGRKPQQPVVQSHDEHTEKLPHQGDSSSPDVPLDGVQQEVPEALQQQREERRVRYHEDSGFRPLPPPSDAGESSVLDVPPRYDAAV